MQHLNSFATVAAVLSCLLSGTARGRHSEAAFDTGAVVAFEATVRRVAWRNPHVYIYVETTDADEQSVNWEIETRATPILMRSGWTSDSLHPGDRVSVRGHPERDSDRNYALLISTTKEDGTLLSQNPQGPMDPARATSLAGMWKGDQTTIDASIDRYNRLPLTSAAQEAKEAYQLQADSSVARCIPHAVPRSLVAAGPFLTEIELDDDRVVVRSEYFNVERVIRLDETEYATTFPRTNQGHSIGRWEGDVPIVDTALFADNRSARGEGIPSGPRKHVIERFSLVADGGRLRTDSRLGDSDYLAEPFSGFIELQYAPNLELFSYDCDQATSQRFKANRL